jgi:hypothetical protein
MTETKCGVAITSLTSLLHLPAGTDMLSPEPNSYGGKNMIRKIALASVACCAFALLLAIPVRAQGNRGKAEMKTPKGNITVDYGRPALKGRDMLSQLKEGEVWRMGMNQATTLTTPVDLMFGSTRIPAGSYSIWLKKNPGNQYDLIFNSQTGQWGTNHDASKDMAKVPTKVETASSAVETFTIDLMEASGGGTLVLTWGTTKMLAAFTTK